MSYDVYDVIIIGAGISGLVAVNTILEKEPLLDILLIEATGRIGGRTLSVPLKVDGNRTCHFDIGGHWVSPCQRHIIKLLNKLELNVTCQEIDGHAIGIYNNSINIYKNHHIFGSFYCRYEIRWFFAMLEEMSSLYKISRIHNNAIIDSYDAMSMQDFINNKLWTKTAKNIAKNVIIVTCGVDPSQISLMYFLLFCNSVVGFTNSYMTSDGGGKNYWIQEGAQEICNRLYKNIDPNNVLLNEPVIDICQSLTTDMIFVSTASGRKINCNHLICAIPPEQINKITFTPNLSNTLNKIFNNYQTGQLIAFVITYETQFWFEKGYSGEIFNCSNGPIRVCYDATNNNHAALTGYIYNNKSDTETENSFKGTDGTFKNSVINQLVEIFGPEAQNPIDYFENNWSENLYSGGSPMSCCGLRTVKWFFNAVTHPVGRIHWAGAETATEWPGHMNGAIQAGNRAAINVLYDLRPQSLHFSDINNVVRFQQKVRLKNQKVITKCTLLITVVAGIALYHIIKRRFF